MQLIKLCDKAMSYITLFSSHRGYYRRNIRILWKYPCSVDIIRISHKYKSSVDVICISWIHLHSVDIIRILGILSAICGYHQHWPYYELSSL